MIKTAPCSCWMRWIWQGLLILVKSKTKSLINDNRISWTSKKRAKFLPFVFLKPTMVIIKETCLYCFIRLSGSGTLFKNGDPIHRYVTFCSFFAVFLLVFFKSKFSTYPPYGTFYNAVKMSVCNHSFPISQPAWSEFRLSLNNQE